MASLFARARRRPAVLGLAAVVGLTALLYAFGLPGGFVLDDYANLQGLEKVHSLLAAAFFLADVPSTFPGRPLSYLSFLAQQASWPGDPAGFKVANIAVHLLNGVCLYFCFAWVLRLRGTRGAEGLALLAAALWLIHPIQVSTVLYVVQRMAQLAMLFSLLALLAYLRGRALAAEGRTRAGYLWMTAAIVVGTPVAVLAKENGGLLPLLIGVVELTLLGSLPRPRGWARWCAALVVAPSVALAIYIVLGPGNPAYYSARTFDLAQRLYTEAGILWHYVWKIVLPRPLALGIYFDDYPVAAPPWASPATAAAIAGWLATLGAAVAFRKRWPFLSFGVLWFLAGHLLESTVIPLELYFEHRNYLPLAGPALAASWGLANLWRSASSATTRRIYAVLGLAAALSLAAITFVEARLWSDPVRQTVLWAREHPGSLRAQYELATAYINAGRYREAEAIFTTMQSASPDDAQFALSRAALACMDPDVAVPDVRATSRLIERTPVRPGMMSLLDDLVDRVEEGRCPRIEPGYARALVEGFLARSGLPGSFRRVLLTQRGRLYAAEGNLDGAVRSLEAADEFGPTLASAQLQVTWLASAELYDDALRVIRTARGDPRWRPWQRSLYVRLFDGWERQVREAAKR